jgi:hypothetical protein
VKYCEVSNRYGKSYFSYRNKHLALPDEERAAVLGDMAVDYTSNAVALEVAGAMIENYQIMGKLDDADAFLLREEITALFCEEDNQDFRVSVAIYAIEKRRYGLLKKLLPRFTREHGAGRLDYLYATVCARADEENTGEIETIVTRAEGAGAPFLSMLRLLAAEGGDDAQSAFEEALAYAGGTAFAARAFFQSRLLFEAFRLRLDTDAVFAMMDRHAADYAAWVADRQVGKWEEDFYKFLRDWWETVPEDAPPMQRYLAFLVGEIVFRENEKNRKIGVAEYVDSFTAYIRRRYNWERDQAEQGGRLLDGDGDLTLPTQLRAVCAAQNAVALKERGDVLEAARSIKSVIEQEPSYRHAALLLRDELEQDMRRRTNALNEMETLLAEIKPQLKLLLATGRIAEARDVLAQLEQFAPDDEELFAMKQQISLLPPS